MTFDVAPGLSAGKNCTVRVCAERGRKMTFFGLVIFAVLSTLLLACVNGTLYTRKVESLRHRYSSVSVHVHEYGRTDMIGLFHGPRG